MNLFLALLRQQRGRQSALGGTADMQALAHAAEHRFCRSSGLWHVVQVDCALQKPPGCRQIAFGSEEEVDRVARAVNSALEIFPVARHQDAGFVHTPASTNGALASTKHHCQHRQHFDRPSVDCGVVNQSTALVHHLLNVAQAQRGGHVPSHAGEHDFQWIVQPLEDLAQGAIDQTFSEIKRG